MVGVKGEDGAIYYIGSSSVVFVKATGDKTSEVRLIDGSDIKLALPAGHAAVRLKI